MESAISIDRQFRQPEILIEESNQVDAAGLPDYPLPN
jgi:hypothetical protein